jgi:hypothetical protein
VVVGVGQRRQPAAGAPAILRRAAQRIGGLDQFPDRVVLVRRDPALPVDGLGDIERIGWAIVEGLVAGAVGISRADGPVEPVPLMARLFATVTVLYKLNVAPD